MTEDDLTTAPGRTARTDGELPAHEVRTALLDLLAEVGTVTATEAAARLGHSSGLCSFHLRQLARHGHIEEAPHSGGRARPWRLRRSTPVAGPSAEDFGDLARGLEDESWQRWLEQRGQVPADWRRDEAFSAVAYLTPEEMSRVAAAIRKALAPYGDREQRPLARPEGARPVALITRLFPLLTDAQPAPPADTTDDGTAGRD
ncbi:MULTISPECIES: winged helix-turn-helix domain-containing protein [Streptomyces]|uniref:Helix-turn-helix domain-containing protein n=1 Tax=Streptomyces yunnanensis TaxID=156453 RepID=A0ABY8A4C8_9ACTN|nr:MULTISPECIES: winged helix-turn-helix domain-containing protein [Streptomyces]AJC53381.1 regulatory protein C ArsR [Streptomyces sp. 769]WEB38412.1 helix-turn-helix domain-containing protein [Streptomyces yunnanensis]